MVVESCVHVRAFAEADKTQFRDVIAAIRSLLDEIEKKIVSYVTAPQSEDVRWMEVKGFEDKMQDVTDRLKTSLEPLNGFSGLFQTARERVIVRRLGRDFGLELADEEDSSPSKLEQTTPASIGDGNFNFIEYMILTLAIGFEDDDRGPKLVRKISNIEAIDLIQDHHTNSGKQETFLTCREPFSCSLMT